MHWWMGRRRDRRDRSRWTSAFFLWPKGSAPVPPDVEINPEDNDPETCGPHCHALMGGHCEDSCCHGEGGVLSLL